MATINYLTNERRIYGRADSDLCFADGYVSYGFRDLNTGDLYVGYGPLGEETVRRVKPGEMLFERGPRGSCRPLSERPTVPRFVDKKTVVWLLWPRLGFINCNVPGVTVHTQYIKARYHAEGDTEGVILPFSCYEVSDGLRYYPFKKAYFALEHDFRSPWPEGRPRRYFWLYPNGNVEVNSLPFSVAIREVAIPTARGLVAFARPSGDESDYWIYLITDNGSKKLLRGFGRGVTSPDGCKVAMVNDPDFKERSRTGRMDLTPATTKVLDLCEGAR